MGNYGLGFWLPQIISETITKDPFHIGLLSMIPWSIAAISMVLVGHHSDKTGNAAGTLRSPDSRRDGICGIRDPWYPRSGWAGRAHRRRRRNQCDGGDVLVPTDRLSLLHRRGGRHRVDQLRGQPCRICQPVSGGQDSGCHAQYVLSAAAACRLRPCCRHDRSGYPGPQVISYEIYRRPAALPGGPDDAVTLVITGVLLCAIGLASMAGLIPPLANYTYSIVWWGLLILVDRYNQHRQQLSLWTSRPKHFILITVPVSVLFWLLFEVLNLPSPQWHYRGGIGNLHAQVFFGFVAFGTVIPIMAESYWLFAGRFCLPPTFSGVFQKMARSLHTPGVGTERNSVLQQHFLVQSGNLAGSRSRPVAVHEHPSMRPDRSIPSSADLLRTRGRLFLGDVELRVADALGDIILPGAPHLFQMPLPGYIGFIPFGLTAMIVYEQQLKIPSRPMIGVLLYAVALTCLYLLTTIYNQRGLWLLK